MNMNVYAIFDIKSDSYNVPFFMNSHGLALRAFKDLASDKNTVVGRHPEDFRLCFIGSFNDQSAELVPLNPVVSLGFATEFVEDAVVGPRKVG